MILFYVWTDTQIINAINVKENVYKSEGADLIVFRLKRVSEEVIQCIKERSIFDNVYILYPPDFYFERKRKGFSEHLKSVFLGSSYRKYFDTKLRELLGKKQYDVFLTGAFWSETVLVIKYIKKLNSKILVCFFEEGLAAYNGPSHWLFQTVPNRSIKATVRMLLYYGISSYTYRKYVKGIFLYKPELSNIDYLDMVQIPPITEERNSVCYEVCKALSCEKEFIYEGCDIVYVAEAPNVKGKEPFENIYKILDAIYEVLPHCKVVLKTHPIMQSLEIEFDETKYPDLYIDKRVCSIERILFNIDIDKKIIITGNSTSALYIRCVYEKNPYMLLIKHEKNIHLKKYEGRYVKCYGNDKVSLAEKEDIGAILRKKGNILKGEV